MHFWYLSDAAQARAVNEFLTHHMCKKEACADLQGLASFGTEQFRCPKQRVCLERRSQFTPHQLSDPSFVGVHHMTGESCD